MSRSEDSLRRNLRKTFKLDDFVNKTQNEAVKTIVKRKQDVFISMPPGSRKSLCFQLPAVLEKSKVTIVLSPFTSVIKSQIHCLKKIKLRATSITSILSDDDRDRITKDLMSEKSTTKFIYVIPEAFATDNFNKILEYLNTSDRLAYFVVDDAHFLSHRMEDFRQEFLKFGSIRATYSKIPWVVLTHNASEDVFNDVVENLQLHEPVAKFTESSFQKNLYYDIVFKDTLLAIRKDLYEHLKGFVISCLQIDDNDNSGNKDEKPCGIIYCKSRETVELVANKLTELGVSAKAHHGGMRTNDRKKVREDWMTGVLPIIVSTISFSSELSKSSIRFIVHWEVPQSVLNYYLLTGMAGRDGKLSYCRIYYSSEDERAIDDSLKDDTLKATDEIGKRKAFRAHSDFQKMSLACVTVGCRHQTFSDYFQDNEPNCESNCDVCTDRNEAQIALDLYHKFASQSTLHIGSGETGRLIKLEPTELGNQPSTHSDLIRITRPVSPANTIIKEEAAEERCVSPADTIIKEEGVPDDQMSYLELNRGNGIRIKEELNDMPTSQQRCVSPAETIVEQKPVVEDLLTPDRRTISSEASNSTPLPTPTQQMTQLSVPTDTSSRNDSNFQHGTQNTDNVTRIKQEPPEQRSKHRSPSPAETIIKDECLSPDREDCIESLQCPTNTVIIVDSSSTSNTPNSTRFRSDTTPNNRESRERPNESDSDVRSINPVRPTEKRSLTGSNYENVTPGEFIKQEPSEPQQSHQRHTVASRKSRSPSPTETVVKDECLSPERISELLDTEPMNEFNDIPESKASASKSHRELHAVSKTKPSTASCEPSDPIEVHDSPDYDVKRENRSYRRRSRSLSRKNKRRRSRNHRTSHSGRRSRSRSRSISNRRSRSRSTSSYRSRERSRSTSRYRRRYRSRERSRSTSRYRRRYRSRSRSRSRSNERENRRRKLSQRIKHRHSSEREVYIDDTDSNDRSSQPSTSTKRRKRNERFSQSPETKKHRKEMDSDNEPDYGYEDPPPLKEEVERKSVVLDDFNTDIKQRMVELNSKMKTEYDLDVVLAKKKALFDAIEESIELNARKQLSALDEQIKKKKDEHLSQLFGTNDFGAWDNDPALSNVSRTKHLQSYKSLVPNDIPLREKMSMKHVINATKLTPVRERNELVFGGYIKEIENEFQGQELPQFLMKSIRMEKGIIADLVKKFLMPYVDSKQIQLEKDFAVVARNISHQFYENRADENTIKRYIDELFRKFKTVTAATPIGIKKLPQ